MSDECELVLMIDHPLGLHLQPATQFVATAARFHSHISICNLDRVDRPETDAKSLFGILQQGVSPGDRVRLRARGADAADALAALQQLVADRFGDAP